ncbi:uncharacterized protein LOC123530450 [Mercenaria mercenaria]|uniref:uncharacterized protein LOC123530450 n=1 Tax=Mercenaria mercenaria TaxID=6596 RepID=UPI00234E8A84|nr:uncharacterized protein LOC123530450 [Mercenaria mercenaria]
MPCSCACRHHDQFSNGNASYIHQIRHKKIKVDVLNYMKKSDLIPRNASAICQICIDYVNANFLSPSTSKRKNSWKKEEIIDDILHNVDSNELGDIAEAIGKRISSDIEEDSVFSSVDYRDPGNLSNFKITQWLNDRNDVLVRFVKSAAGNGNNPKKEVCIVTAVDSIYKARRLTHVAPLQFCKNLVNYYLSGSKVVAQLNNRQTACGSYSSLQRWLKANAQQPVQNERNSDQITFFDNNQVIARNWRVTFGHKTTASVITMLLHITPALYSNLQESPHLTPRQWLFQENNSTTVASIRHYIKEAESKFDTIRNCFLASRLKAIVTEKKEQTTYSKGWFNGPINKIDFADPYAWATSCHPDEKPHVKVGEPALFNPCSYDSVKKVLKHVQDQCHVGDNRTWTCVGCDGLPYVLGSRLIEKNDDLRDILLVPGLGHIEMTAVKACFKLLWDVCLQDLAKMLGYRTPRALMCCKACPNHHKSWMILTIFFYGTIDEILTTYISQDEAPTVAGLYTYIGSCKHRNFRFMCDVVLNYVLAIFAFRCCTRRNNTDYIMAGKSKFMKLFYGLNHTNYQEIMYRDFKTRVLAPTAIKDFICKNESFSVSGNISKGEGGDFVLEAYNRRAKRWLPPGIPKQHHWVNVCRNLNLLEKVNFYNIYILIKRLYTIIKIKSSIGFGLTTSSTHARWPSCF